MVVGACQHASGRGFITPSSTATIFTDASLKGWGAHLQGQGASGLWDSAWSARHINQLELQAVILGLLFFEEKVRGRRVLIRTDSTTVMAYISRMGGGLIPFPCTHCPAA